MQFHVSRFKTELDYNSMKEWEDKRMFPGLGAEFLPKTGFVVSYEKKDENGHIELERVCVGFLFSTDSSLAVISHLVSDPNAPGPVRNEALDLLIKHLIYFASKEGFQMVTCATNLDGLKTRFERHGLTITDENVTHYGRILCH